MKRVKVFLALAGIFLISFGNKAENREEAQQAKETKETQQANATEKKIKTIHLTKADFLVKVADYEKNPNEWKYLGDKPAVIDFYADWCGPCRAIAPSLEELADEYDNVIYIYKINVDKEKELSALFGIRSIPSLLFIPMEEKPQMVTGAIPKSQLKEAIDTVLLKKKTQ